jgi:hypothetical protein
MVVQARPQARLLTGSSSAFTTRRTLMSFYFPIGKISPTTKLSRDLPFFYQEIGLRDFASPVVMRVGSRDSLKPDDKSTLTLHIPIGISPIVNLTLARSKTTRSIEPRSLICCCADTRAGKPFNRCTPSLFRMSRDHKFKCKVYLGASLSETLM